MLQSPHERYGDAQNPDTVLILCRKYHWFPGRILHLKHQILPASVDTPQKDLSPDLHRPDSPVLHRILPADMHCIAGMNPRTEHSIIGTAYAQFPLRIRSEYTFNQPGVELYKRNMFRLLGKPGYEA